jgi:hypothetical protein
MSWEIIGKILNITTYGGLAHLIDFIIRLIGNMKVKRFARYGAGVTLVFPANLKVFEALLDAAGIAVEPDDRRRIMWIFTAAFFLAFVPFGVGVVIATVLEQILGD